MSDDTLDLFGGAVPHKGGTAGRDNALAAFEEHRHVVVQELRKAALKVWRVTQQPVTVNDVRHVLVELDYDGDPRILGAAFPRSEWIAVGWDTVRGSAANARPVRQFVPRPTMKE